MFVIRPLWHKLAPRSVRAFLFTSKIFVNLLQFRTGHHLSSVLNACVDQKGNPLPWYTYPAIDYLKQLNFSDKTVFEYGAGNSTLFWSALAHRVISVESNLQWYERIRSGIESKPNAAIYHHEDQSAYIQEISKHGSFDVIVIDGIHRTECAQEAVKRLKPGGMIIFDNADRFIDAARFLRDANLIEIDMFGVGPLLWEIGCTSLFLHREFAFTSREPAQPLNNYA
jgi:hypothetical protein